jgi:flagellar hook protein FlgE
MIYGGIFMIRAMYAGISGLKVNQEKLDVVGNNIANVNTTAYKYQRMRFQNTLSQSVSQGTSPSNSVGGTNPVQIGLGAQVGGIDTVTTQGNLQPTSRNLDFAVDGTGYFVVGLGTNDSVL